MRSPLFLLALALGVSLAAPTIAEACKNATLQVTDASIKAVRDATIALDEGDPAAGRLKIRLYLDANTGMFTMPKVRAEATGTQALANKIYRVMALSTIRIDAALYTDRDGTLHESARKAGLEEAVDTLKTLADLKPDDALRQTDYAEALAKTSPAEAKKKLEALAKKDVLATPYAYAALARLRAAAGDGAGATGAIETCKKMTKADKVCSLATEKPKPRSDS